MRIDLKSKATPIALAMAASFSIVGSAGLQAQESYVLEEIIITARKIEESIQDVPLSIIAFGESDIADRSIEELDDVALFTPGLSFEDYSNGGFGTPIIRGASQFSVSALEQNVSTFIDGVYIPRNYALDLGALDMERIEVVKGPQSALYGANAFMGAINYETSKADLEEFDADVGVVFGSDGRADLSGDVSIPIVPGRLAVKLAGSISQFDGDWDNAHPEANSGPSLGTDDSIGGWDNDAYSVNIVAAPTDNTSLELAYHSFDVFSETKPQSRLEVGDLNCGGSLFGGPPRGYCGELPETPLLAGTTTPTDFVFDPRGYGMDSETDLLRLDFSVDITDALSLSYQFANIQGDVLAVGGSDRSPLLGTDHDRDPLTPNLNAFTIGPAGEFDYDSHELRFEFTADSGLYAMIGGFYSDGEDIETGGGYFAPIYTDSLAPLNEAALPPEVRNNDIIETDVTALFGRVSMPLLDDRLVLSAEGRYTDEKKDQNIIYNDPTPGDLTDGGPTPSDTYTDSYFTPRLTVDYNITDDQLLYLSLARGIKTGGLNPEISGGLIGPDSDIPVDPLDPDGPKLTNEREYGPDENDTIEIGSKNTLFDGRIQLNAAVYYTEWENLQVTQAAANGGFFTTSIVGNLGAATLKGLELDLNYAITDGLTFNAGIALNDASYDDGTISQRLDRANICDDANTVCNANGDISGNSLPRSSDTQWNIGLQYDGSFGNNTDYFVRADAVGQSKQYVSEANITTIPSRQLLNLRGGVSLDNWSAEVWVKNATDEEYVSNAFYIPSPFFVAIVPSWAPKRRIGLTLDYSF